MERSPYVASVRGLLFVAAVVLASGAALTACSSKGSGTGSTATSTTGSGVRGSTSTSGGPGGSSTTTKSSSSTGSALGALAGSIQSAKNLSFSATYAVAGSSSTANSSLTYAQMPPKSFFKAGPSELIDTGSGNYSCSDSNQKATCVSFGGTNPLSGTLNFVTGGTEDEAIKALKAGIAEKLPNFSASFSTATYAGQSSQCLSGTASSGSFKYCFTGSGVLAYAGGSTTSGFGSLTLTAFSTNVSSSEFSLPAGATVVTVPTTTSSSS